MHTNAQRSGTNTNSNGSTPPTNGAAQVALFQFFRSKEGIQETQKFLRRSTF